MPKKGNKLKGRPNLNFDAADLEDGDLPIFSNGQSPGAKSPAARPNFMSIWKGQDGFSNSPIAPKKVNPGDINAENPMYSSDNEDEGGDRRISMLPDPTDGSGSFKRRAPEALNGLFNGANELADAPEPPPRKKSMSEQAVQKLALLKRKMSKGDGSAANDGAVTFIKRTDIGNDIPVDNEPEASSTGENGDINGIQDAANGESSSNEESSDKNSEQSASSSEPKPSPSGESPSDSELSELSQLTPEKEASSPDNSPKGSVVDESKGSPDSSPKDSVVDESKGSPDNSPKGSVVDELKGSPKTSPKPSPPASVSGSAKSSPKTSPRESTTESPKDTPMQSPRQSVGSVDKLSIQPSPKSSISTPPKLSPPPSNRSSRVTPPVSPKGSIGSISGSPKVSPKTSPVGSLSTSPKASPKISPLVTPKSSTADKIDEDLFGASNVNAGASSVESPSEANSVDNTERKGSKDSTLGAASTASSQNDDVSETKYDVTDKPQPPEKPTKPLKPAMKKQGPSALSMWKNFENGEEPQISVNAANDEEIPISEDGKDDPQNESSKKASTTSITSGTAAESANSAAAAASSTSDTLKPDGTDGAEARKGSYEPVLPFFPTTPAKTTEARQESATTDDPPDYLSLLETEGPRRLNRDRLKKASGYLPPRTTSTAVMPDKSKLQAVGKSEMERGPDYDSLASSESSSEEEQEEEEDDEEEPAALAKKVSRSSPPMIRKARPSVSFAPGLKKESSSEEEDSESELEDAETLARKKNMKRKMTPSFNKAPVFIGEDGQVEEGEEIQALSEEQGMEGEGGDEETDPLLEGDEDGDKKKKKKKKKELDFEYRIKKWDVFLTSPVGDDNSARDQCYDTGMKIMKIIYIIISFIIVLGLTVMNKVTLTIATSNSLAPHVRDVLFDNATEWPRQTIVTYERTWYCNKYFEVVDVGNSTHPVFEWRNTTKCLAVPPRWIVNEPLSEGNLDVSQFSCLRMQRTPDIHVADYQYSVPSKMYSFHSVRWTWCLWLMIATPEFFVFFRCAWRLMFKKKNSPNCSILFRMLLLETLQTIGQCILVFRVLPRLDHAAGAVGILTSVAFIPSLLSCFIVDRTEENYNDLETEEGCIHRIFNRFCSEVLKKTFILVCNFVCMGLQAAGLLFFPFLFQISGIDWHAPFQTELQFTIPISLFLISMTWWLNYIGDDFRWGKLSTSLDGFRRKVKKTRTKIYLWASLWKILVSFICMIASYSYDYGAESDFGEGLSELDIMGKIFQFSDDKSDQYNNYTMIGTDEIGGLRLDFVYVWLINSGMGLVVYFLCRTAAKVHIQLVGYALPLMLSTPVSIGAMLGFCEHWSGDPCFFEGAAPSYLFWQCPVKTDSNPDIPWYIWVFFAFWLSQYWIGAHIWKPKSERLAQTDKLFLFPLFNGIYLEQWLVFNRNRKDKGVQSSDSNDTTSVQRLDDAAKMDLSDPKKKKVPTATLR